MSGDAKQCVRRFYDEVWNRGNVTAAGELAAPDCVRHDPSGPVPVGPAGFAAMASRWRAALPDLRLNIDLLLAEADPVAARWTITGTQTGPLGSIAPSGKAVTFSGVNIFRIASGRIAEIWNHRDDLRVYQQIGALPPLPPWAPRSGSSEPRNARRSFAGRARTRTEPSVRRAAAST